MLLYVLKSFKRQTARYRHLICILILGMIIPLMLSVLASSSEYGKTQQTLDMTHGCDFKIPAVPEELTEAFERTGVFTAAYIDNGVFLKIVSANGSDLQIFECEQVIDSVLKSAGMEHSTVYNLTKSRTSIQARKALRRKSTSYPSW